MPEIKKILDRDGFKFGLEYLLENMPVTKAQQAALDKKADASDLAAIKRFRAENGILTNYVNYGYIENNDTLVFFDGFASVEDDTLILI